jgi:hypothetical protein
MRVTRQSRERRRRVVAAKRGASPVEERSLCSKVAIAISAFGMRAR